MASPRKPPLELDVEAETAEGTVFRLSANDPKAQNRPSGISFTTQRGDGFGTGSFTLSREIFKDYPDLNLMDTVRFVGRQGDIAYEGRVLSLPRDKNQSGPETITVNLVGWMTYLKGRPMNALIIDRRLNGWQEASTQRTANLLSASYRLEASMSIGWQAAGAKGPGVLFSFTTFDGTYKEIGSAWFYAGGADIGAIFGVHERLEGGAESALWHGYVGLSPDDLGGTGTVITADFHNGNGPVGVGATAAGQKYAFYESAYEGEFVGTSRVLNSLQYPRVVGIHGLTIRGTAPAEGYYLTDIIQYLLTFRPKIQWAGETNSFVVEQATWHDSPSNPYDAIQQLNNLVLWETNVWEDRKFYFEPADLTKTDWQIKTTDPGVSVNFQGDSIESTANGCVVTYSDFFGHTYRLEPTNYAELRDENDNNPANRHGEENWIEKQVPWPCLEAEALQFGRAQLGEYNRPKRPGSFTIKGYIKDGAGHYQQGWQVRNSQTLGVMDHPLESEPRLITATSWDEESESVTITTDAPPQTIDAIVARNELALQARNLS